MAPELRALVVGTDDWAIDQAASRIEAAGHVACRCHDTGQRAFPCSRFSGGPCPVDDGVDVVITVRGRVARDMAMSELGAVCGLRAEVPLVIAGVGGSGPFDGLETATVPREGDVVAACADAARRVIDLRAANDHSGGSVRFRHA